jgi:DNA-binding LacI/PurR family transcriptional regulator
MSQPGGSSNLRDVAAAAGVSVKTVSNVVNGYAHVSDVTRAKVQQAIDELRYRPNLSARNLRQGRSGLVALAVPELEMPYFAEMANHIVRAAEARGWTVLIDQTDGTAERENLVLNGIRRHLIDGVIFNPLATGRRELEARLDQTPIVLLGERVYGGPVDHVSIDNAAAAQAAVTHLLELGRTRIAAIGEQRRRSSGTARLRLRGYTNALKAAGLQVDPDLVRSSDSYHRADGAAEMEALLALPQPPDAVFCFNDLIALGALRTLLDRGVRVPEDVAVVGFDDIDECAYSTPSLTTVAPDKAGIAAMAVDLLASRLEGRAVGAPRERTAPHALVVRESSVGRRAMVPT